ncbi:MAG: hypothetical protein IJB20_04980 [Clostridia bacterium]|nr:hypothetical protein [Clostridia bacterium]
MKKIILLHGVLVFAFATVMGLVSNILLLLVSYIISLPHLFDFLKGYYMNLDEQKLWLLYAVVSQVCCTVGCGVLCTHIGASAARFFLSRNHSAERVNLSVMSASIGLGTAAHGFLCAFTARLSMAYLFFAAPVPYIARFLGNGTRSLFADIAFRFPYRVVLLAAFIYCGFLFSGACIGYMNGWKKQFRTILESEAEKKKETPPEKTWSPEDAVQIPFAYRNQEKL